MIKLMIAEDEYMERKALRYFLDKYYSSEIKIVAEVANGENALSQALIQKVDIILLDIQMPKLDGLKAAELIKEDFADIEIIILTAHSKFEYAKKSIHIGISDYLVKPYLEEEFREVLDKTIEKIKSKKKKKSSQLNLKNKLAELTPLLEQEIILEIIYGTSSSLKKFVEHKKLLDINSNNYMFLIIGASDSCMYHKELLFKIKKKINRIIDRIIASIALQDMVFLLLDDEIARIKEFREFKELIFELKCDFKLNYHTEIIIAQSQVYNEVGDIYHSYNQAKSVLMDEGNKIKKPYQREKVICGKIIDRDLDAAIKEFNNIFSILIENYGKNAGKIKKYLKEFIILLNRDIKDYFGSDIELFSTQQVEKEIFSFEDLYDIKIYIQHLISKVVSIILEYQKDGKNQVIETVKNYIKENYNEDISLSEMAKYTSFSRYYLSRLFKEVEGINFKDYIIKVRMEKAKKLLKSGKKIKDIADLIGYSNPNYFSSAFKKYTGVSPTKYLKS
ncbi:MAG: response regulator [Firmicutes bacterium]|nr:response regulator [Bacillota bacterium]